MRRKLPSHIRARSWAADMLYEAHLRDLNDSVGIYSLAKLRETETTAQTPMPSYTHEILESVVERLDHIDAALTMYSRTWSLHRMPEVDLAITRMATWKILFNSDVDGPVAVTAAVQLATGRSTDESPKFINGLLGIINDIREALIARDTPKTDSDTDAGIPEPTGTPIDFDTIAKAVRDYAHQESRVLSQIDLENLK